jgi:hypothetical protein
MGILHRDYGGPTGTETGARLLSKMHDRADHPARRCLACWMKPRSARTHISVVEVAADRA